MSYPLITWGTAADLSTWTQGGTCSVTSGQTDPFGGTSAFLLTDGSAATRGERYLNYTALYPGYHMFSVWMKQFGTDPVTSITVENLTDANFSSNTLTWASGVPTSSFSGQLVIGPESVLTSTGWYLCRVYHYAGAAGQSMRLHLYPSSVTVTDQTSAYFYLRNATLLDRVDAPMTWEESREGSAWAQGGGGIEDAWIQGTDFHYSATVRWQPFLDRSTPVAVSGWNGPLETTGVNCGVSAMLRAGRNKEILTFFADRTSLVSESTWGVPSYLVAPMNGAPTIEANGDRSFTLELRNASRPYKPFETV